MHEDLCKELVQGPCILIAFEKMLSHQQYFSQTPLCQVVSENALEQNCDSTDLCEHDRGFDPINIVCPERKKVYAKDFLLLLHIQLQNSTGWQDYTDHLSWYIQEHMSKNNCSSLFICCGRMVYNTTRNEKQSTQWIFCWR